MRNWPDRKPRAKMKKINSVKIYFMYLRYGKRGYMKNRMKRMVSLLLVLIFVLTPYRNIYGGTALSEGDVVLLDTLVQNSPEGEYEAADDILTDTATDSTVELSGGRVDSEGHLNTYHDVESVIPEEERNKTDIYANTSVTIPSSYDSRDYGYITPVKDQNPYGTCWSFAAIAAMEASLIKSNVGYTKDNLDLSELHNAYFFYTATSDEFGYAYGDYNTPLGGNYLNRGGNSVFTMHHLASWRGGAAESEYPYEDADVSYTSAVSNALDTIVHMQDSRVTYLSYDRDGVKQLIMEYGAVAASYYSYYYYNGGEYTTQYQDHTSGTNHAITIVGWDDNFSREYFNPSNQPSSDGAWLIKNSWGSEWGDDGYFWLSYEDTSIQGEAFAFIAEPADNYDHNYQHDGASGNGRASVYGAANIFKIDGAYNQTLDAVSMAIASNYTNYTVQIYKNPASSPDDGTPLLETPITGTTTYSGYYTVEIDEYVVLEPGDVIAVVFKFDSTTSVYVDYTYTNGDWIDFITAETINTSYYEVSSYWYDYSGNGYTFRIKAFTNDIIDESKIDIAGAITNESEIASVTRLYTGEAYTPSVTVTYNSVTLTEGVDYTVTYKSNINAGRASIVIIGKGNYRGSKVFYFTILPVQAENVTFDDMSVMEYVYEGEEITPDVPNMVINGKAAVIGEDYELSYTDNVYVGTATVIINFTGNYYGDSIETTFKIVPLSITDDDIDVFGIDEYYEYTGSEINPSVTLCHYFSLPSGYWSYYYMEENLDFTVRYENCVDLGTGYVCITGIGNFEGEQRISFEIVPAEISNAEVTVSGSYNYTGSDIKPMPTVTSDGKIFTYGTDFTCEYYNNKNVGTASVMVSFTGNYTGTAWGYFDIMPLSDFSYNFSFDEGDSYAYIGLEIQPSFTITVPVTGETLVEYVDYTYGYSDNINPGIGYVNIEFIGNYSGTTYEGFEIYVSYDIGDAAVVFDDSFVYTGSAITPEIAVFLGENALIKGTDYTVAYSNNTAIGTATVTITGMGNYTGTKTVTFEIVPIDIAAATVSVNGTYTYTGSAVKPVPTVVYGGVTLTKDVDYTVSYSNNTNAGTATITVTGKGIYGGTCSDTFEIGRANIADATADVSGSYSYTGSEIMATPTVKFGSKTLTEGTDYTLSYSNNINVGTATITVTGKGNFTGSKTVNFTIGKKNVSELTAYVSGSFEYVGSAITPLPTVMNGTTTLTKDVDYTISYSNNVNAGTGTITITGKGNYTGTRQVGFEITPKIVTESSISYYSQFTYTGSPITPSIVLKFHDIDVVEGVDYYIEYSDNINAGTATMKVIGMGNWWYVDLLSFTIIPKGISLATATVNSSYTYTGSAITPLPTVKDGNATLKKDVDYTLSYSNNVNIGTATITITGKGNYKDTKTVTFAITAAGITSSKYTVANGYVSKINAGTTVATFLAGINEGVNCKVYKGTTPVTGTTNVGTGMVVKYMSGNTVIKEYTIMVTGDVSGDGAISITDMIAVKAHILKKTLLSGVYSKVADTSGDGSITITDFVQIKSHILKKSTITGKVY